MIFKLLKIHFYFIFNYLLMNLEENQIFKYEDKSKNIFSKINFVNCLTLKEIQQLNEKYKELRQS